MGEGSTLIPALTKASKTHKSGGLHMAAMYRGTLPATSRGTWLG